MTKIYDFVKSKIRITKQVDKAKIKFFGVTFFKMKRLPLGKVYFFLMFPVWLSLSPRIKYVKDALNEVDTIVINHLLGGGTALYYKRWLSSFSPNHIVNLQKNKKYFFITVHINNQEIILCTKNFPELLFNCIIRKVIINHLINWDISTLHYIEKIKVMNKAKVLFNVHDYYCYCKHISMTKQGIGYCNIHDLKQCSQICGLEMQGYHAKMKNFLTHIVDEINVFSRSSQSMLTMAYPLLSSKIKIIPHQMPKLEPVHITQHDGINIIALGSIFFHKGSKVLFELNQALQSPKYSNIKLKVIGVCPEYPSIYQTGSYKLEDLNKLLQIEKADIIFISSICPETFSYTTHEAIATGLPVACFNIGAQQEAVSQYSKGVILDRADPDYIISKLTRHLHHQANNQ